MRRTISKWIIGFAAATVVGSAAAVAVAQVDQGERQSDRVYATQARELADIAAWANREGLVGLSPASLHPLPCRGLSPASAQDCPPEVFDPAKHTTTAR